MLVEVIIKRNPKLVLVVILALMNSHQLEMTTPIILKTGSVRGFERSGDSGRSQARLGLGRVCVEGMGFGGGPRGEEDRRRG